MGATVQNAPGYLPILVHDELHGYDSTLAAVDNGRERVVKSDFRRRAVSSGVGHGVDHAFGLGSFRPPGRAN
jgi:hypothetical protein